MKKIMIASFVMLTFFGGYKVFAESPANNTNKGIRAEENAQLREQIREERCQIIANRIEARMKLYDDNKVLRENVYADVKLRVGNLVAKFKERGYDVTKLEEDLKTWDTLTKKLWTDRASFINSLGNARNSSCGATDGEFKLKFQESKDLLRVVQSDAAAIRDFFKNTLKVDIQSVRNQKVNN